jgi:hypothetical protein
MLCLEPPTRIQHSKARANVGRHEKFRQMRRNTETLAKGGGPSYLPMKSGLILVATVISLNEDCSITY